VYQEVIQKIMEKDNPMLLFTGEKEKRGERG